MTIKLALCNPIERSTWKRKFSAWGKQPRNHRLKSTNNWKLNYTDANSRNTTSNPTTKQWKLPINVLSSRSTQTIRTSMILCWTLSNTANCARSIWDSWNNSSWWGTNTGHCGPRPTRVKMNTQRLQFSASRPLKWRRTCRFCGETGKAESAQSD